MDGVCGRATRAGREGSDGEREHSDVTVMGRVEKAGAAAKADMMFSLSRPSEGERDE